MFFSELGFSLPAGNGKQHLSSGKLRYIDIYSYKKKKKHAKLHHLKGRCVPKSWLQYPVIRRHLDEALSTKGISACSTQWFLPRSDSNSDENQKYILTTWELDSTTLLATLSWLAILKRHLYLKNWEYLYENGSMGFKDYVREDTVVENHWFLDPLKHMAAYILRVDSCVNSHIPIAVANDHTCFDGCEMSHFKVTQPERVDSSHGGAMACIVFMRCLRNVQFSNPTNTKYIYRKKYRGTAGGSEHFWIRSEFPRFISCLVLL